MGGFNAACAQHKIKPAALATTPGTTSLEVEPAARMVTAANSQAVVMGLGSLASPHFVRALRKAGYSGVILGLSVSLNAQSILDMGGLAAGIWSSIVVPSPFATKFEIVRRYQADMLSSGFKQSSLPSMETYIDAAVLAEGLRRSGASPNRASLVRALNGFSDFDVGGVHVSYSNTSREGSRFVDVAVLDQNGSYRT